MPGQSDRLMLCGHCFGTFRDGTVHMCIAKVKYQKTRLVQGDLFSCDSCDGTGDMPGVACSDCCGTGLKVFSGKWQ